MKPLLSICIPTYNRAHYLESCLHSIYIQCKDNPLLQSSVEVVVSNNCSTDSTEEVVKKYRSHFEHYTYVCNETNVGLDMNVVSVVKNATGVYCWYLGDDDTIVNGGINHIINLLKTNQYDVVTVEAEPVTQGRDYETKQRFLPELTIEVNNYNDFYFRGFCQGGFSVLIFNRELWLTCLNEKDYLLFWIYFETVLRMLPLTKKKMVAVKDSIVITGQDCRWSEDGGEIYTFINSNILMERMIGFGFDAAKITKDLEKNRKQIILMLVRAKGHNLAINKKNFLFIKKNTFHLGFLMRLIIIIVFFVPNTVIKAIRSVKKYLSK